MRTAAVMSLTLLLALACAGGDEPQPADATVAAEPVEPAPAPVAEPEPAPAPASEPEKGWMVIVAGDKDEAAAREKYEAYDASGPAVGNFPAMFVSDEVEGLNAGFHIVVAGIPRDKAVAQQMAKALGETWEGTYIREVTVIGVEDVTCDEDPRCAPRGGWKVLIVFDYTDGMTSEDWAWFSDEVITRAKAAGIDAKWESGEMVEPVIVGNDKVAEVDLNPFMGELFGYVFAKQGAEPEYQAHAPPDLVLSSAQAYFGVEIE